MAEEQMNAKTDKNKVKGSPKIVDNQRGHAESQDCKSWRGPLADQICGLRVRKVLLSRENVFGSGHPPFY